ncbi:hypothetical protein KGG49_13490 [Klebsiella aerogenes]|uniref:hypothetical protein n=1 Tax=Klebsiella aerogenes TaxID=548 RepID=UPI001D09E1B5|nr:hypothetical protein [Klebsiella aerogenes]MCB8475895.1 hypothetical protein [Klebsiella aerogenes]
MTITLQAVNELIQSLESAGELSIKERKYLDLAKAYADKESESVAQALTFEKCRELSGCPAGVDLQDWVKQLAAENVALKATSDDRRMFIMNGVQLGYIKVPTVETDPALETIRIAVSPQEPTPATDRIVAGFKADGVEDMANHFFKLAKDEANSLIAEQWRESGRVANEQAKQLREGADK